jgi:hypothetical protein
VKLNLRSSMQLLVRKVQQDHETMLNVVTLHMRERKQAVCQSDAISSSRYCPEDSERGWPCRTSAPAWLSNNTSVPASGCTAHVCGRTGAWSEQRHCYQLVMCISEVQCSTSLVGGQLGAAWSVTLYAAVCDVLLAAGGGRAL